MKLKLKLMAAAIALVAASGANAAVTTSSTGNGELFFTVYDSGLTDALDDDRAYVRDLGSLVNGSVVGGALNNWASITTSSPLPALPTDKQAFGTIFSVGADSNLQSFLAASDDTSRLKWNIAAVDSSGTDRILTTAGTISAGTLPSVTLTQFRTYAAGADVYLAAMNPALTGESALYSGAGAGLSKWGANFGGKTPFSTVAGLGGSQEFFVLSERASSGTTGSVDVRQYMADASTDMQWTFAANGALTYGALAPIPEPETYALMLAGLGMLGVIARRRRNGRA